MTIDTGKGIRIRNYWSNEVKSLLEVFEQFEVLNPSEKTAGSAHHGEDGRYVENLVASYLRKGLPKDLEILTGFIYKPDVWINERSKIREKDSFKEKTSKQLDLIIYDSSKYPVYNRVGNSAMLIPEGVVGVISIKKTLRHRDLEKELATLKEVGGICSKGIDCSKYRGPFLGLLGISLGDDYPKDKKFEDAVMGKMTGSFGEEIQYFDEMVNFVGTLKDCFIYKRRPLATVEGFVANYKNITVNDDLSKGIQHILTGILNTFYARQAGIDRPGYVAFDPDDRGNYVSDTFFCAQLRRDIKRDTVKEGRTND